MPQKRYAYLIGANGPVHQSITPLQYAEKDIEHLQRALGDSPCEFIEVKSTIATNPSDVLTDLERLATSCERSDLLMVHFSGHGKVWGGHLYLICNTTQVSPRPLLSTAININQIKDILDQCNAKHKLLVLDCCHASTAHAGGAWRGEQELERALQDIKGSVSAILSACAPHKPTRELDTLELYHDRGAGFLSWTLAAACSEYFTTVSRDGALSLSDVLHWLPGARDRINEELEPDGQIPLPRLLSERDIAGDDEVWFTGRRRGYIPTVSLEERQQREEHVLHNQESFLRQYCSGAEIGDFDEDKILAYARKQQGFSRLPLENIIELCKRLGLASSVGTPRRSAVLAFHKFPNRYISPAVIRVTLRTLDNDIYSIDTVEGFLGEQVEKAVQWLISNLRTIREDVEVGQRIDRCEISEKALQELVVNAVLHRDYEANESIQIKITPKQIIITNPGRLNSAIVMRDAPFSYRASHPRNPELLDVLIAQRWAEGIAHGFEIITEEFQKYGLTLPDIENLPGGLVQVTIQRPDIGTILEHEKTANENISTHVPGELNVILPSAQLNEKVSDVIQASVVEPPSPEQVWNVPFPQKQFFTGREALLKRLHTQFRATQATLGHSQVISGLGGIGKTELAVEYAYRHQQEYQAVLWAHAETTETLTTSYIEIARLLQLSQKDAQEQEEIVQRVKDWLSHQQNWLLILDNADEPDVLIPFLPPQVGGHLIVTTRAADLSHLGLGFGHALNVPKFTKKQDVPFLLRRAGLKQVSAQDREYARRIADELDGLPLALNQAGVYLATTGSNLASYWGLYQRQRATLLNIHDEKDREYPRSVSKTLLLSFEQVEQRNPAAADLLRLCAFLAPDAIPEELLTKGTRELRNVLSSVAEDAYQLDQAFADLRAYSLLIRDPQSQALTVHRLVQAVLRDSMVAETQRQWKQRAVQAVSAASPNVQDVEQWDACDQWVPHVLVCATWIKNEHLDSEENASLLNRAAYYLDDRARYREAEPLYLLALAIREQQLGVERLEIASSLNNLALLYMNQGKYTEAEPLLKRALTICEPWLRAKHPTTTPTLMDQAVLYIKQGKYAEAKPLLKRALATREQELGAMHPDTAQSLNNLAALYEQRQGEYAEAEPLLKRALAICEQWLGSEHPDTTLTLINQAVLTLNDVAVLTLNNLALLYFNQEKYTEAEPLYLRGLKICEQRLGAEHLNTARILNNLGALCVKQGKYAEAEPLLKRALATREQELGAMHPDTAQSLNSLAALYKSQRRYAEAEPLLKRALAICEHVLGSEHPITQKILKNYTLLLQEMEGNGGAEDQCKTLF